jgi:pimeloyl-ACP methyl ester carboxylesterase
VTASLVVHDLGGRGPTLVMVHATGLHGRVWAPVASHLSGRFRCLAPDLRAHGESPAGADAAEVGGSRAGVAWPDLAADLLAAVEHLPAPVFGLGHSLGATLLLLAEEARPATFAGLYCIEPIGTASDDPPPPDRSHPMATRAAARRDLFASRNEARAAYAAKPPFCSVDPGALAAYVEHGFEDTADGRVRLRCRPADEAAVFATGLSHPVYRDLGLVAAPVVLAVGGASSTVTAEAMGAWAARLGRGRVEVLPGLGHFAPLEDPAAVAAAVAAAYAA